MAFQGIKNQGTDPLQLFLAIRQLRQQEEQTKQDQTLARVKAAQDAQKFRSEMQKAELDRLKAVTDIAKGMAPQADAAGVQTQQSIGDILQSTGIQGALGENADRVFDAAAGAAFAPVEARIGRTAQASGLSPAEVRGEVFGEASAQRVARSREIGNEIARENREEARTKRREKRAEKRKIDEEIRTEKRRTESEDRARLNGYWEKKDLIAERNSIDKQLTKPVRLLNEGWNALEKFEQEGDAKRYLEIVQRWIRLVDEGATVREGDIALVDTFSMSGWEKLNAAIAGATDAEGRVTKTAKDSIASAFRQILEESDRGLSEEWGDRIAYADEQNWNDRERAMAIPRITAVRRMIERHESRQLRSVALDSNAITEADRVAAERRIRRRLNVRKGTITETETINELKKMVIERQNRGAL